MRFFGPRAPTQRHQAQRGAAAAADPRAESDTRAYAAPPLNFDRRAQCLSSSSPSSSRSPPRPQAERIRMDPREIWAEASHVPAPELRMPMPIAAAPERPVGSAAAMGMAEQR
jgi:hypothetical protein